MKSYKLNNKNNGKNKTKKNKIKQKIENNILTNLTSDNQKELCENYSNKYVTFEDKVEETFKKKHIDIALLSKGLEKQIINEFKKAVNITNITPQNDFYSYINYRWIRDFDLETSQKYIVEVDDFRIVQDKVYRELIEIIENYIKNPKTKNTKQSVCIKNAYSSFLKYNTNEEQMILANSMLSMIDEFRKNKDNLWKLLAFINKNEIISWSSPFVWTINPDDKNPKIYSCYLEAPQLTLIDIEIYFNDTKETEYKKKYRQTYLKYLKDVFEYAFGKNNEFNVNDILKCETKLAVAMYCNSIKDKDMSTYNLITKDEALKIFKFDWETFTKELGFKKTPQEFVTSNVNYLLCGTKLMLDEWDSPEWRTYWIYIYIKQQQRWSKDGFKIFYDFQGKFVRGQELILDKKIKPIFSMAFLFNTFLTNKYIEIYKNQKIVNYVKAMSEDLKIVFKRIIRRNNWLEPKTTKRALKKLDTLQFIFVAPDNLNEDPLLDYDPNDTWGNLVKMAEWRIKCAIELTGKSVTDIPVIDWSDTPPKFIGSQTYVVNASYTPTSNSIYIPLGYMQKPFVDLDERGIEYNLSRIGFAITHEMSHVLDDWGCQYDENGVLEDWWTSSDKKKFKKIQYDIVKQYETFAGYDGIKLDAWASIGESIADISGLTICREYLRDFQLKNETILPIQKIAFEAFFIYFAVKSRQKINKKAILAQLKTNPHPLDKYRCNVPLSRSKIFRSIFNVKKGDKMWWHTTNRIWED
jgi:predicted metalloendopeptidase